MTKFSAEMPKGDGWGVEDVVADAVKRILSGEKSPLIPVVGVIDIKNVAVDPESGNYVATVRVRRVESLTSAERIREAQRMLMEQWADRKGNSGEAILSFEDKQFFERAFGNLDAEAVEREVQDEKELTRDEEMTEEDRLRAHMVAVHGYDPSDSAIVDWPANRLAQAHEEQHNADDSDKLWPDHDPDSMAWRRVEIAELVAEAEEPAETEGPADEAPDDDAGHGDTPVVPDTPAALFDDGNRDEKS